MPQRNQHPLVYVLLIWISILTIAQLVFIPYFFSRGQPTNISNPNSSPLPVQSISNPIEIVNFKAQETGSAVTTIKWVVETKSDLIGNELENPIKLMKDGHYIVNLQVTLSPCGTTPDPDNLHSVILKLSKKTKVIGKINETSHRTVLLSKARFLASGTSIEITICPKACINPNTTVTYLDILWLKKLQH